MNNQERLQAYLNRLHVGKAQEAPEARRYPEVDNQGIDDDLCQRCRLNFRYTFRRTDGKLTRALNCGQCDNVRIVDASYKVHFNTNKKAK
jgi:hypothetical protein